jgi:hypothetical protein
MITAEELKSFMNTEKYYKYQPLGENSKYFLLTDGTAFLTKECKCIWLINLIYSLQPQLQQEPMLKEYQFWNISKVGKGAKIECFRDKDDLAYSQDIPETDLFDFFADKLIRLYLYECQVLMLPSEY